MPILSFVIPVYNSEKYLKECVESILNFKSDKIEVILINDGSQDNSSKICDEYQRIDQRIKVIHQTNKGVAAARNTGIENSNGKYIFFVDNDDWVQTNKLEQTMSELEKIDPDIFIHKYFVKNEENNTLYLENSFIERNTLNGKSTDYILDHLRKHRINVMAPWEYIVKKEIIVNNNLRFNIEQNGVDDSSFSPILFCSCNKIYFNNNTLYTWRWREDSQGKDKNMKEYIFKLFSTIKQLEKYEGTIASESRKKYILFSIYKNTFSLFRSFNENISEKATIYDFIKDKKNIISKSAKSSGIIHSLINSVFGNILGLKISYNLARLKNRYSKK